MRAPEDLPEIGKMSSHLALAVLDSGRTPKKEPKNQVGFALKYPAAQGVTQGNARP